MSQADAELARRKGDYGFDAPLVPALLGAAGVVLALIGLVIGLRGGSPWNAIGPVLAAVFFLLSAGIYVYTTRIGKFVIWTGLLRRAGLRGDERLLDMGSGRQAARRGHQRHREYADRLRELGMEDVRRGPLGWRFWYGGPWMAASLVTARKPAGRS